MLSSKLLLTDLYTGLGREICLFVDRVCSQVDRRSVGRSSKKHWASYGSELSPLPLAKSRDDRWKLILKTGESGDRKGALKSYFHVGEELTWRFQFKQNAKAQIARTLLTRAYGVNLPLLLSA